MCKMDPLCSILSPVGGLATISALLRGLGSIGIIPQGDSNGIGNYCSEDGFSACMHSVPTRFPTWFLETGILEKI